MNNNPFEVGELVSFIKWGEEEVGIIIEVYSPKLKASETRYKVYWFKWGYDSYWYNGIALIPKG